MASRPEELMWGVLKTANGDCRSIVRSSLVGSPRNGGLPAQQGREPAPGYTADGRAEVCGAAGFLGARPQPRPLPRRASDGAALRDPFGGWRGEPAKLGTPGLRVRVGSVSCSPSNKRLQAAGPPPVALRKPPRFCGVRGGTSGAWPRA
jgi:hypothetical protein